MEIDTEDILLQKCRSLIEERLGWGSSEAWVTQDYEMLGHKIQEATNVSLSVATLKRIWGKVRYESKPTLTTLNTLAQYLGFENWRAFTQSYRSLNGNGHAPPRNGHPAKLRSSSVFYGKKKYTYTAIAFLLSAAGLAMAFWFARQAISEARIDPSLFSFGSRKTTDVGVPNTVIFEYDASHATPADTLMIQQSWDARLRRQVAYNQKQHTSIYYYPGFFEAKLVVNGQVVKEHKLFIRTDGWLPLVEQKPVPVYYKESDARRNGMLSLSGDKLKAFNIATQPSVPWTAYYNVRDFGNLKTDDAVFETELKNDYKEGAAACQMTEVHLLFEGGALVIPLSIPGCVSELNFMNKNGKTNDLSLLGCDFSNWVKVLCTFEGTSGKIYINGKKAFDMQTPAIAIRVVGIVYRFQGTGSVNSVKLSRKSGEVVFEDQFGTQ